MLSHGVQMLDWETIAIIFTILGGIGSAVGGFFAYSSYRRRHKQGTASPQKSNTLMKKPDHVKTVATTIAVAPPVHEIGHAAAETIMAPTSRIVDSPQEIIETAANIAGSISTASLATGTDLEDAEDIVDAAIEATKGIL